MLKKALDEARATVSSCLALTGVKPRSARKVLGAKLRAKGNGKLDADSLLTYVSNDPGQRGEEITGAFSRGAATLRGVMKPLIEAKQLRTEGEKRGTRYVAEETYELRPKTKGA